MIVRSEADMSNTSLPDPDVLGKILQPLLSDFQHWFEQSQQLLEAETLSFLEPKQQSDLLARIQQAQNEVTATRTLLQATDGQAIVEMPVVLGWHNLVAECWKVAIQFRASRQDTP